MSGRSAIVVSGEVPPIEYRVSSNVIEDAAAQDAEMADLVGDCAASEADWLAERQLNRMDEELTSSRYYKKANRVVAPLVPEEPLPPAMVSGSFGFGGGEMTVDDAVAAAVVAGAGHQYEWFGGGVGSGPGDYIDLSRYHGVAAAATGAAQRRSDTSRMSSKRALMLAQAGNDDDEEEESRRGGNLEDGEAIGGKYPCSVCKKTFGDPASQRRHERNHRRRSSTIATGASSMLNKKETKSNTYKCNLCQQRFSAGYTLKKHIRVHTREKPFSCDLCNEKFSQWGNLRLHMQRHLGINPYRCPYCDKAYIAPSKLEVHIRGHTNERPYGCDVCCSNFKSNDDLRKHMMIHCNYKPFTCWICQKSFMQPSISNHLDRFSQSCAQFSQKNIGSILSILFLLPQVCVFLSLAGRPKKIKII